MRESVFILFPVLFPIVAGLLLLIGKEPKKRSYMLLYTGAVLLPTCFAVLHLVMGAEAEYTLFSLNDSLPVYFRTDVLAKVFASVVSVVWVLAGFFSFSYMKKEAANKRYFGFYLIVYGILVGLDFAGNLITFYMFYEFMTLLAAPLILHSRTKEAILASLKYLFYSFCGAYMALFGIYIVYHYSDTMTFTANGLLKLSAVQGHEPLLLTAAFLMILGFSVKAGMFPMHGWLTSAHPVAPAPASAVLSGIIVKGGILGIIRTIYYVFGAEFLRGTWVQTTALILSLITVFLGSMLAYLEKGLKKRLAYSTVSQLSYILFGLFLLNPTSMTGSLLHVVFHALIKSGLFLCAGAIIFKTGKHDVEELRGIGKQMPITMICYTVFSLALIGIPPTSGVISKWYLCVGALESHVPVFSILGPVILLVSALLTAGYLLPITINGFFPGRDFDETQLAKAEPDKYMLVPIIVLALGALLLGIFPGGLVNLFSALTGQLM